MLASLLNYFPDLTYAALKAPGTKARLKIIRQICDNFKHILFSEYDFAYLSNDS